MKTLLSPIEVRRETDANGLGNGLLIRWTNGEASRYSSQVLRKSCPCATCQEKRGAGVHQTPLTPKFNSLRVLSASIDEELNLVEVWAIGNYALGLRWADAHDSGIYSYQLLNDLRSEASPVE